MARFINVEYMIEDDEYERIVAITDEYRKKGLDMTPEKMFESIMCTGSKYDKDDKLKFHEWTLGLRDNYK